MQLSPKFISYFITFYRKTLKKGCKLAFYICTSKFVDELGHGSVRSLDQLGRGSVDRGSVRTGSVDRGSVDLLPIK